MNVLVKSKNVIRLLIKVMKIRVVVMLKNYLNIKVFYPNMNLITGVKYIFISIIILALFLLNTVSASNSCGKIDVYFNDKILPGKEVAKPYLKINEPFKIRINITVYKEYKVSGTLTGLGEGYFEVIDGPSEMNEFSSTILKANESHVFEWTVVPTNKWAGGSIPINFHYSIVEKGNPEPVVNSGFTVAYCTISNEYYEDKNRSLENQPISEVKTPTEIKSPSTYVSTPAFLLPTSLFILALAFVLCRKNP